MYKLLPRLTSAWAVDNAIVSEEKNLVVIRFGYDESDDCILMDSLLYKCQPLIKNFAVIYTVDLNEVVDFIEMFELYSDVNVMFFHRNKHIQVDLGTGDNNKITFPLNDKQELIDIIELAYRAASKGKGLVSYYKDFSKVKNKIDEEI